MSFELAKALERRHLLVYPPDLEFNPPQSYLFVQDFLILFCAITYCFCYIFYTTRTKRDKFLAAPIDFIFVMPAYEVYYPFVVTCSKLQVIGCLVWLLLDVRCQYTVLIYACPPERRFKVALRSIIGIFMLVGLFRILGQYFPDEGEQVTAYWTGWLLQSPCGWISIFYLRKHGTKGQSLGIWATRFSGAVAALGVFAWRYYNVPQNWAYVASWPSIGLIAFTFIPEVAYPVVFLRTKRNERETRQKAKMT